MLLGENKSLQSMTSLKVGGTARYFGLIASSDDVSDIVNFAKENQLPFVVLGGGCNTLAPDGVLDVVIGKMAIIGTRIHKDFDTSVQVEFGAGMNWDDIVEWSVSEGLSGIEALSGIPGSVGAAPIQNIGAYGTELSKVFVSCRAISTETGKEFHISLADCDFDYRNSNFKRYSGQYVITHVTLELSKKSPAIPEYKDVKEYFKKAKRKPTLRQIRNAILEIRSKKLPDPLTIPNAGSFFVNPILDRKVVEDLLVEFPDMPFFSVSEDKVKLLAGWLIDKAGLKGADFGNVGVYPKNALVLTTNGKATYAEVSEVAEKIKDAVRDIFRIDLEVEPRLLI